MIDQESSDDDWAEPPQALPLSIFDQAPSEVKLLFENMLKYRVDPAGLVYGITLPILTQQLAELPVSNIVSTDS